MCLKKKAFFPPTQLLFQVSKIIKYGISCWLPFYYTLIPKYIIQHLKISKENGKTSQTYRPAFIDLVVLNSVLFYTIKWYQNFRNYFSTLNVIQHLFQAKFLYLYRFDCDCEISMGSLSFVIISTASIISMAIICML